MRHDPCDCGSTCLLGLTAIVLASLAAFAARAERIGAGRSERFPAPAAAGRALRQDSMRAPGTTGLMREESQLDEMRAAIRGDFERLAERRGEQELMRIAADEPEPHPEDVAAEPEEQPPLSWTARLGRWLTQPGGGRPPSP